MKNELKKTGNPEGLLQFTRHFNTRRIGARVLANIGITAFVAGFSMIVPKIYMISKTNPKTDALKHQQGGISNG